MHPRHLFPALLLALGVSTSHADALPVIQKHCASCHGEDGIGIGYGTPHLNGQLDSYLIDMMQGYQRGKMPTSVPKHIPAELGAAEIREVAAYFMAVKAVRPKQETDPAKVARGEKVHADRCSDCHLDNGREFDKSAPLMAAQNIDYLIAQSRLFVSGKRKFGFLQDEAFQGITAEDLEAVAHFFGSQEQYVVKTGKRKRR